uniref:L1 transposable element RRM domain-containing protein n=1 Tax=Kryptolebias marmoratus TaxID=37003 RepID=A0A3Q2ZBQ9_KRYMA
MTSSEMNKKLEEVGSDIHNQAARLTEAEQRVNELETVNMDLRDSLSYCLKQQKNLLDKVTDLEGRSRRNNICIYGIKEEAEGNSMQTFIANFLKEQLSISQDLQIQRAHRSLGPKPRDAAISRSILVNFHRYDIKEKILKAAWGKRVFYDGKLISFAHDLPTEINNKLKEYRNIKKILKEGKIRFQTPYPAKMRIHWDDGPRLYADASEAADDMRKRGYRVDAPRSTTADGEPATNQDAHWNKAASSHFKRVREKLREFQREQV